MKTLQNTEFAKTILYIMVVMGILKIKEIFVNADERIYARICHLIWKYSEKFENIIPLMGGFYQCSRESFIKDMASFATKNGTRILVL